MTKENNQKKILKILEKGPMTLKKLKYKFGTNKDIRNPLQILLMENKIIPCGYNLESKNFNQNGLIFKKVIKENTDIFYIKHLIENALYRKKRAELLDFFQNRIYCLEKAYMEDKKVLFENLHKIPLNEFLSTFPHEIWGFDRLEEINKTNNYAAIWSYSSNIKLKLNLTELKPRNLEKYKLPYIPYGLFIDKTGNQSKEEFIKSNYESNFYFPLKTSFIEELFKETLLNCFKSEDSIIETKQWELAENLGDERYLNRFADFIREVLIEKGLF